MAANAFDYIFGFFGYEAFGQSDGRNGDVVETECFMAFDAREMHMTKTLTSVVVVAYAVFLSAAAVIDVVKQVGVAEKCQSAEKC